MFDFIRKPLLWSAWDAGHGRELGGGSYHLKTAQDLGVYQHLRDLRGQKIAEVGGGASRILHRIAGANTCYNIEKFEGADGGPAEEIEIDGVENKKVFLGEFSDDLQPDFFDVVFSVSVVEHVPNDMLGLFLDDGIRILKPGGLFLHAIDVYIQDQPNDAHIARFDAYRAWVDDSRLEALDRVYRGSLQFTCDMVTNPDLTMYNWGRLAPQLIELRQRAQSTSLLVAARKK